MISSPYRRAIVAESKKRGGRGGKGNWRERIRPPKDHATPFLLIAGEYKDRTQMDPGMMQFNAQGQPIEVVLPYYPYEKHVRNLPSQGNKTRIADEICSRGSNPHQPMPCVGCFAQENGDRSIKLSSAFAVGTVHLVPYHGHPILDRQTNTYLQKKDGPEAGKYVLGYDECLGRACNFCRVLNGGQPYLQPGETFPYWAKDITTVFGHRRYFDIGKNGLQDILGWDLRVASTCFGPGYLRHPQTGQLMLDPQTQQPISTGICGNQLTTVTYNCSICHNPLIDMSNEPRTDAQIQEVSMEPYNCAHCQRPVDLYEVVECDLCGQPKQVNVFSGEVVLWLKRQGEGTSTHMVLEKLESLDSFIMGMTQTIAPLLPQGKQAREAVIEMARPYDFEELMKPKDLAGQSRRLELPIPPQFAGQQQYMAPRGAYGPPQQGGPPPQQGYGPPQQGYGPTQGNGQQPPNFSAPPPGYGGGPGPQGYQPPAVRPNYA